MQIRRFGIRLVRLEEKQIEMIRLWRNSPEISSFMEFRQHITSEMQRNWFKSLHPLHDFYFVIEHANESVGLIHCSEINWKKKSGNSGLFIWKKDLLGSPVPVLASLAMVDFFFEFCTLEKLFAKVMKENPVAVKYNEQLGFKPAEKPNGKSFLLYSLIKEDYVCCTVRLHEMAESVGEKVNEIQIESDLLQQLKTLHAINPEYSAGKTVLL